MGTAEGTGTGEGDTRHQAGRGHRGDMGDDTGGQRGQGTHADMRTRGQRRDTRQHEDTGGLTGTQGHTASRQVPVSPCVVPPPPSPASPVLPVALSPRPHVPLPTSLTGASSRHIPVSSYVPSASPCPSPVVPVGVAPGPPMSPHPHVLVSPPCPPVAPPRIPMSFTGASK